LEIGCSYIPKSGFVGRGIEKDLELFCVVKEKVCGMKCRRQAVPLKGRKYEEEREFFGRQGAG
jgi:hypothetical protein